MGHFRMAEKMLNMTDDHVLHDGLICELNAISILCERVSGRLVSRQAIAVAIVNWQERTGASPMVYKDTP